MAGSGPNSRPLAAEVAIERGEHDARLHADAVALVGHDAAEVAREIDDQPAAERLAGQAGAGAAGVDRQMILGRVADRGDHVVDRPRPHDAQRPQLVDAGVAGVELREEVVAADVALQQAAQVFFDSLLVWVHGEVRIADCGLRIAD